MLSPSQPIVGLIEIKAKALLRLGNFRAATTSELWKGLSYQAKGKTFALLGGSTPSTYSLVVAASLFPTKERFVLNSCTNCGNKESNKSRERSLWGEIRRLGEEKRGGTLIILHRRKTVTKGDQNDIRLGDGPVECEQRGNCDEKWFGEVYRRRRLTRLEPFCTTSCKWRTVWADASYWKCLCTEWTLKPRRYIVKIYCGRRHQEKFGTNTCCRNRKNVFGRSKATS